MCNTDEPMLLHVLTAFQKKFMMSVTHLQNGLSPEVITANFLLNSVFNLISSLFTLSQILELQAGMLTFAEINFQLEFCFIEIKLTIMTSIQLALCGTEESVQKVTSKKKREGILLYSVRFEFHCHEE